jgi:ubiquinol-cytochrome c reductase cytochrome b subunit
MLHFLLPFLLIALAGGHILVLHSYGSRDPVGADPAIDKVPFYPYFSSKDYTGFLIALTRLAVVSLAAP